MSRFARTRTSRTVASVVVIFIAIGAAFQFHRNQKLKAGAPPLQMSVGQPLVSTTAGSAVNPPAKSPAMPTLAAPLVTQTPDPGSAGQSLLNARATGGSPPGALQPGHGQLTQATPQSAAVTSTVNGTAIKASAQLLPTTPVNTAAVLSDASSKVASGDLIEARTQLNSALLSGSLSEADTAAVKRQMAEINQTLIFSPRQFPHDPLGGVYQVKSGDRLASIGNAHQIPYELLLPLNRMTDARKLRYGQTLKVINGPFNAVVTKSKFTLDVYLGSPGGVDSTYITTFMVGLGTDNSTPTGTWSIRNKVTHPAYFPPEGHAGPVLAADDPKNPLGAYWMGLEGTDGQALGQQSYGIHGTIDPTSIGKQSSMGCIRLKNEDVEVLYKLLTQGKSRVIVRD